MNNSQKVAIFVLIITIILLIFTITIPIAWSNETPVIRMSPLFFFVLAWIVMGASVVYLRKKHSACEVDYDERDIIIKQKAIFASYITLWILVLVGSTIPPLLYERGMIANLAILVYMLPVTVFLMFIIVMLVYSLAILIQYGRQEK